MVWPRRCMPSCGSTSPLPALDHGAWMQCGRRGGSNEVDKEVLRENVEATGTVVMVRRLFDFVDGPYRWSDDVGYGAELTATPPVLVVTHRIPKQVRLQRQF